MKQLGTIAWWLVIVGALNWGLVGAFNYDLVGSVLGMVGLGMLAYIVFIIVGLSGIYLLAKHFDLV